jgi:hypothetical protein
LFARLAPAQTIPASWKVVKDSKSFCQIAVPPEWTPFGENSGAAVLKEASNAIAVVTSQPGQEFKPLPESIVRSLELPKDKLFENSAKRVFYQDRIAKSAEETNAVSASVPRKGGTCSCHVVFASSVAEEVAKKIALSLGPVTSDASGAN